MDVLKELNDFNMTVKLLQVRACLPQTIDKWTQTIDKWTQTIDKHLEIFDLKR